MLSLSYMKFFGIITAVYFLSMGSKGWAQQSPVRYQSEVFEHVKRSKNLHYVSPDAENADCKSTCFDFYEPIADTATKRPLVIWMHGGGFKLGKKTSRGIPRWCRQFAKKGYVCAAINYTKSKKKPFSSYPDLVEACYEAILDLQQSIGYFRQNTTQFRIDSSRIFLGGNSAGAMIALQAVYSKPSQLQGLFDTAVTGRADEHVMVSGIAGIISFWGCLFDTAWLSQAKVPIVLVHGTDDNIVPYKKAETPMFGSYFIHQQANAYHIPNALKPYEGLRHELQKRFFPFLAFSPAHRRWHEAGEFAAEFLYQHCFR